MLCHTGFRHVLLPYAKMVFGVCLIHCWVFTGWVGCTLWLVDVTKPTHFYLFLTTYSYSTNLPDHFAYHIVFLCYHVTKSLCQAPSQAPLLSMWLNPMTNSWAPVKRQSPFPLHNKLPIQTLTNSWAPVRRQSPFPPHDTLPTSLHSLLDILLDSRLGSQSH